MTSDLAAAFDAAAEHYDDDSHGRIAERLLDGLPPAGDVLDVATGTGAAAFAALRLLGARRVVAVDIAPAMIARARERAAAGDPGGRIEWWVAPAVPAPVPDASADAVLCASSLHFLGAGALADWLRVLRPGGSVAYTLPGADTFNPSPAFARLVAADLVIPATGEQAAEPAVAAGFTGVRATRAGIGGRTVYVVHGVRP
ncbi:class I SAM-dependent methyltransferase [Amycolatopsis suaedae]|uniref:Class I SAM-dependent methyltransferase n=1 Tax=Amycolatopsis suaedae TaxID=2510978 RepID=A0A4Q7J0R0_9PSEU|nr:class I SAM-dependent methyltransferase [Amycolatopsis suaedae]RZQ60931.1 class I SAM-dependent methyltransferase [Amycolatopsis suaedae]